MNTEQTRSIGEQIVTAREALGWSQGELANRSGFSDNTVRKVERGEKVAPGTLRKILDTVGIEPLVEQQKRIGYPADVELVRDLVGMYLVALPDGERAGVAFEITRFLMARGATTASAEQTMSAG